MQRIRKQNGYWLLPIVLFWALLCLSSRVMAGGMEPVEEVAVPEKIELQLYGVDRLGAVQLFDFLLKKSNTVISSQQIGLRLSPDEPQLCKTEWSLTTAVPGQEVQENMMTLLRDLESEKQNDILYEAPFIVMKEDLEMVKKLIPFEAGPGYLLFAMEHRIPEQNFTLLGAGAGRATVWYKASDKGFE